MLLDVIALVLILLVTAYYASQGVFSAALSLVAAIFGSVLAMGLFEPLEGIIGSYKPAYARGITFLLLFLLGLSACRLAADFAVKKNVRFTKAIDMGAGAVVGFFAAMVIVGSCIIGLEMLPLPTNLFAASWGPAAMGFDRYPETSGMEGSEPGVAAAPRNVWLAPDRLTLAIWNGVSGRGLGGSAAFDDVHPDLTVESYGYRNTVQYAANSVLVPDLLAVDAYASDAPDVVAKTHVADGKQAVVARITVSRGSAQPKISADEDVHFRITSSEVRLVTDKGKQYYPVGQLVHGVTFQAMPLDKGHLIDDYVSDKVIEEWVFQIDRDEKPRWLEVKELARVDLSAILKNKPFPALAVGAYPKREYLFNHGSLEVRVEGPEGAISGAKVYLMPVMTKVINVKSAVQTAYDNMKVAIGGYDQGTGAWGSAKGLAGVPQEGEIRLWENAVRTTVLLKAPSDDTPWEQVIPALVMGAAKPDGAANISSLPQFFENSVVPLMKVNPLDMRASGETAANGTVTLKDVSPGDYELICSASTSDGYYCWFTQVKVEAKKAASETLKPTEHCLALTLKK